MKTRIISAALAALLTTVSGVALAQDAPPPPHPHGGGLFMHADANKDGIVTRAELLADVDARFAKFDVNHDGRITADERPGRGRMGGRRMHGRDGPPPPGAQGAPEGGPHMARRGPPADTNHDGVITREEQRAQALKLFDYIDRNGDGRIDKAERENFRDAAMALGGPGRGGPGMHGRHGGPHGRHGPPPAGAPEAPQGQ